MTQQQEIRSGHPYFMYDAIHQQPEAVARMLETHSQQAKEVASRLAEKRRVYIVGIGTSWHAALIGEHWFRHFALGTPEAQAWHSFEFIAYPPPLDEDCAAIIVSHRGTKTYSFQALDLAKERGALTVAITSTNPGPRILAADILFHTVESERSAAFTVSYTTAMTVLGMLASQLGVLRGGPAPAEELRQLERVPEAMRDVLQRQHLIQSTAERFQDRERFLFTGWGPNTATAYEVALKMKETSYTSSEGFQVEQILHGPLVATNEGCLLTLIAPPGPGYQRSLEIANATKELGTPIWALVQSGDVELSALATEVFTLGAMPELWSPFVYVVPLQLLTYFVALAGECNPDVFHLDDPKFAAAHTHYTL